MKKNAKLPIITKLGRNWQYDEKLSDAAKTQLELEIKATDIWSLLQADDAFNRQSNDFLLSPNYINNN